MESLLLAKIREEMARQEISQKSLEEITGIPHPTMYRYFHGKTSIPVDAIGKMLNALGLEIIIVSKTQKGPPNPLGS